MTIFAAGVNLIVVAVNTAVYAEYGDPINLMLAIVGGILAYAAIGSLYTETRR